MEIQTESYFQGELISKSGKLYKEIETLDELVKALHVVFDNDHVNVDLVKELMLSYKSKESEWKKFAKFDRYKYTRNLVDSGNGKFNLMILCWGEGHASPIHDHADAHCFMKMLKGELEEIRYNWPENEDPNVNVSDCCQGPGCQNAFSNCEDQDIDVNLMDEVGRSRLPLNAVCYINDSLGLHRVENPSNSNPAVSLHLYCPPFDSCHIFNQQTGKKTKVQVSFWSKYGEPRDRVIQDNRPPEDK